jgi:hypothetical protein
VIRVPEPTVSYTGRWSGRDHRRYVRQQRFQRVYTRVLSEMWLDAARMANVWTGFRTQNTR